MRYASQLKLHSQHAETVEVQTILLKGRSEEDIVQNGTNIVKPVIKEVIIKVFANLTRIYPRMPA